MKVFIHRSASVLKTGGRRTSADEEAGAIFNAPDGNRLRDLRSADRLHRLARMPCAKPSVEQQNLEALKAGAGEPGIRVKLNDRFVVLLAEIPRMGGIITDPEGKRFLVTGLLAPASSAECDLIICVRPESQGDS